jgi:hypothetical protein
MPERAEIDDLILSEARTFLKLPCRHIAGRWHGVSGLLMSCPQLCAGGENNLSLFCGPGPLPNGRGSVSHTAFFRAATVRKRFAVSRQISRLQESRVYSLHLERPFFEAEQDPGVHIVTAPGGSGMTLSFGLAERTAQAVAA